MSVIFLTIVLFLWRPKLLQLDTPLCGKGHMKVNIQRYQLQNNSRHENSDWKMKELRRLRHLVQRRITHIQNPKNCDTAKKILCKFTAKFGYGAVIHDGILCLIVAYVTQRTLIIDSSEWVYTKRGLGSMFLPLSTNCTSIKNQTAILSDDLNFTPDIQIVQLPRVSEILKIPRYLPLSIPDDLADDLIRIHENPSGWWIGQFLRYLTRQNEALKQFIEENTPPSEMYHPIVGIHVRRTDKISEAKYYTIAEYMSYVDKWFNKYEENHGAVQRKVFLASDDPDVLKQARKRYTNYTFLTNKNASVLANNQTTRFTESSLRGILLDIELLSMCDFVVCTLTSNVGRVVYELMHVRYLDAPSRIESLDVEYSFIVDYRELGKRITSDNERFRVEMPTYPEVT